MITTGMIVGEWFWEEAYKRTENLSIDTLKFSLEMLQVYEEICVNTYKTKTRLEEQIKSEEGLQDNLNYWGKEYEESIKREREMKSKLKELSRAYDLQRYARSFKKEEHETEKLMSLLGQHVRSYLYSSFIPKPPIIEDEIDIINTLENIKKDEQLKEMLSILLVDYELREKVEKEQQKIINEILKINKLLKKKMDDMKNLLDSKDFEDSTSKYDKSEWKIYDFTNMDLWKKIVLIVLASLFLMASVGMFAGGVMFMHVLVVGFGMIGGSLLFAFFASLCIAPFGTINRNKKRQLQYQKTALEIFNKKYYVEKTGNYPAVLDVNENMNLPDTIKSIDNCFEERNAIIANTKLIKYKNVFANYAQLRVFYDILISYRADNFKEAMQLIKSDLDEIKKMEKANQQIALQKQTIRTIKEEKAELKKYIDDMKSDMTKQMMRLDNRISSTTPTTVLNMRSLHIG